MRSLVPLLLIGFGPAVAAPVPKDFKKPRDQDRLVGTWVGTAPDTVRFQFAADGTLHTWHGPNPQAGRMGWTWAVTDPKATPRRARINRAENPSAGYDCVYEWTGGGLKFALILSAQQPPPAKVEKLPGLEYHELTREPSAK